MDFFCSVFFLCFLIVFFGLEIEHDIGKVCVFVRVGVGVGVHVGVRVCGWVREKESESTRARESKIN